MQNPKTLTLLFDDEATFRLVVHLVDFYEIDAEEAADLLRMLMSKTDGEDADEILSLLALWIEGDAENTTVICVWKPWASITLSEGE